MNHHLALAPGLLVLAEVAYRQEQVARDLAGRRRPTRWWGLRRRAAATHEHDLILAA